MAMPCGVNKPCLSIVLLATRSVGTESEYLSAEILHMQFGMRFN